MSDAMSIKFSVEFFGPFRVATGEASSGADVAVSHDNPIPASSLKGVLRAEAVRLVGENHALIGEIFGGSGRSAPWAWTDVVFDTPPKVFERSRVAIDEEKGSAIPGALVRGQEQWSERIARFRILWRGIGPPPHEHQVLLRSAGAAVKAFGADRRRGFGWVQVRPEGVRSTQLVVSLGKLLEAADASQSVERGPNG